MSNRRQLSISKADGDELRRIASICELSDAQCVHQLIIRYGSALALLLGPPQAQPDASKVQPDASIPVSADASKVQPGASNLVPEAGEVMQPPTPTGSGKRKFEGFLAKQS